MSNKADPFEGFKPTGEVCANCGNKVSVGSNHKFARTGICDIFRNGKPSGVSKSRAALVASEKKEAAA